MIEALNLDSSYAVLCLPAPNSDSEYSGNLHHNHCRSLTVRTTADLCVSFFDQAIARNMVAIDTNSKGRQLV